MDKELFNPKTMKRFCSKSEITPKITLSLKEQDDWEDYFSDYKKELLDIKERIDKTDGEIDGMVYGICGLREEGIKVVEGVVK